MPVERTVKAEFPTVPECYKEDAPDEPWRVQQANHQRAREAMVAAAEIKILGERLKECFYREGVNHYRNCEELARAYVKRITSPNMRPGPVEMDDIPP